jgi:hypothetical protein
MRLIMAFCFSCYTPFSAFYGLELSNIGVGARIKEQSDNKVMPCLKAKSRGF